MSDFNWRHGVSAGLALIVAFAVGGYILGFGLGEQVGKYKAHTDTYAHHARDEIARSCARLDGVAQTKCIIDVVESTNEHERAEGDLHAQRNMARWALWMLLATVLMAVVTAVGVFYVWLTLKATQAMAKEQYRVGCAQSRAYVGIRKVDFSDSEGRFRISNTGMTPALDYSGKFRELEREVTIQEIREFPYQSGVQEASFDILDPNSETLFLVPIGANIAFVSAHITYRDVFGRHFEKVTIYKVHRTTLGKVNGFILHRVEYQEN